MKSGEEPLVCTDCGAIVEDEENQFCTNCGSRFEA
jgi:rRNA maturation endonuclease Nob1